MRALVVVMLRRNAKPLTRSLLRADATICQDVISGYDGKDDRSLGSPKPGSTTFAVNLSQSFKRLKSVRIGVLKEGFEHSAVSSNVKQSFLTAVKKVTYLGISIEEVSLLVTRMARQSGLPNNESLVRRRYWDTTPTGQRGLYMSEMEYARLAWTNDQFHGKGLPFRKERYHQWTLP